MVVKRQCSFCAGEVEPGTGTMFVKRDGSVFYFCSGSCRKQQLHLGRVGHRLKWTRAHAVKRAQAQSTAQRSPRAPAPGATPSRPTPPARSAPAPVAPAEAAATVAATPEPAATPAPEPAAANEGGEKPPVKPAKSPSKPRAKAAKSPPATTKS